LQENTPVRTLSHVPWMDIAGVRAVVWALGREHVRFVGGCVRDLLLGRTSLDVDIATDLPPAESLLRLRKGDIKVKPIGFDHGSVVAFTSTGQFEITTLRRDIETDGRHATVAFTDDWTEDAQRRDFTMNSLSVDPDGHLFDPCGGLTDLEAGVVRFIGNPDQRISEDVLRLLRFFRFSAWYSRGGLDRLGLAAAARAADKLPILSGERVSSELRRLLGAPDPTAAVDAMAHHQVLRALTPVPIKPRPLHRLVALERSNGLTPAPVTRLAAMLPGSSADYAALADRLRFSKVESGKLQALARPLPSLGDDPAAIRRALYRVGDRDRYRQLVVLAIADGDTRPVAERLKTAADWPWPQFPIGGLDLIEIGVKPGPHIGEILKVVQDWWVRRDFGPDRADCLAAVRKSLEPET
jgi:poly(A) polymerase